jgi:hypothetical protein
MAPTARFRLATHIKNIVLRDKSLAYDLSEAGVSYMTDPEMVVELLRTYVDEDAYKQLIEKASALDPSLKDAAEELLS